MPSDDLADPVDADRSVAVLSLAGEIDLAITDQLSKHADELLDREGLRHLVLDFAENKFLDSTGIACLVHVRSKALVKGVGWELRDLPERVLRVLRISGLIEYFGLPDRPGKAVP